MRSKTTFEIYDGISFLPLHSSSDSRDASDDMFGQQQQQQQGVPQFIMNPWDPSQAPVMTLAPLANAMQAAYHQQMLLQQQVLVGSSHHCLRLLIHFFTSY